VQCVVCLDASANCVLHPCGHLCMREACSKKIEPKCPVCRKDIQVCTRVCGQAWS
jgi:hypothetical protein